MTTPDQDAERAPAEAGRGRPWRRHQGQSAAERARVEAEAARDDAEERAAAARAHAEELETSLAQARAALQERQRADGARDRAKPKPTAPPEAPAAPSRLKTPPAGEDSVQFATRGSSAWLIVLLGVAALVAAAVAVDEAYDDRLTQKPGLMAVGVTLVLVFVVGRMRAGGTTVSIEKGIVNVDDEEGRRRLDLTTTATRVELIGAPGEAGWKIVFLFKDQPTFSIDDSMVDPVGFTDAVRRWREL